jgi:hypothetical protein
MGYIQGAVSGATGGSSDNVSVTLNGVTAGSTISVFCQHQTTTGPAATITTSGTGTINVRYAGTVIGGSRYGTVVDIIGASAGTHTITATGPGGAETMNIAAAEISETTYDGISTLRTEFSSSVLTNSLTPTVSGTVLLWITREVSGRSMSGYSASFTEQFDNTGTYGITLATLTPGGTSALSPTCSMAGGDTQWTTFLVAYQGGGGGGSWFTRDRKRSYMLPRLRR